MTRLNEFHVLTQYCVDIRIYPDFRWIEMWRPFIVTENMYNYQW